MDGVDYSQTLRLAHIACWRGQRQLASVCHSVPATCRLERGSRNVNGSCESGFQALSFSSRELLKLRSRNSAMAEAAEIPQSSIPKSSDENLKQSQVPTFSGFPAFPDVDLQMLPIMYPMLVPGFIPSQNQEQNNRGGGIYAVPVLPFMGPMAGLTSNTLIPLTYNVPTPNPAEGAVGEEHGQEGRQQHAPQRQVVVRRFQFGFQLDLLLILKLAAVVFVFNQDGSRQRLILLLFFASFVYLYQTGALTPLIRWLSQGMHRAGAPPQPQAAARAENGPAVRPEDENAAQPEGQPGVENENQLPDNANQPVENENPPEPGRRDGVNWWGIAKEIQMIVVGFVTSLLPGFHNVD
ncbi:uncharacterized protein LOC131256647 isoform X2 [Magnolia sinica]|uniref:uncharacterized protein LOC131256647 isoform X2 n=1 Tax=Magnolia sinica TaxID=86752 RepID=UPI002658DB46|nr:uncharacterized protein LOC131256647 isoform X2 [Magnolia sinica]